MLPLFVALLVAGGEKTAAPLTLDTIRDVVHEHRAKVRKCYDGSESGKKHASGKLVVHFVISEAGTVGECTIKSSAFDDSGLEACVVSEVKSWVLPKPKHGPAAINFPFQLGPVAPGKAPKTDDEPVE